MDSTNGFCTKNCSNISELEHKYQFFISKFSHEARNQLTLINSSLQLIAKEHPEMIYKVYVTEQELSDMDYQEDKINLEKNII